MFWWFKWIFILCLAIWIGYYRHSISKLARSRTKGSSHIISSSINDTEEFEFYNRIEQNKNGYFEFKHTIYKHGICGDLQIPPRKRKCTPFLHIHYHQTEKFTLIQGQLSYQLGDKIYSCDIDTCPSPLIIPPLVPHTFWMTDNKEDLIFTVRVEPQYKGYGMRAESVENIFGVTRDKHMTIWQAFVFLDNIETYPIYFPISISRIIFKICSLIGQILGYQIEYEEYTTRF